MDNLASNTLNSILSMLIYASDLAFGFWWIIILSAIGGGSRRKRKTNILPVLLVSWILCAFLKLVSLFNPDPLPGFFIPEPLNTMLFIVTGIVLFGFHFTSRRREEHRFLKKMGQVSSRADLLDLGPTEFEDMVTKLYQLAGHQAKRTGTVGDNGVDVAVNARNGEKWIVQCKRWRKPVGEPILREFYGTMQHEKADKGTLIAVSGFTRQAQDWVKGKPITLYDGEKFLGALERAFKTETTGKQANKSQTEAA